MKTFLSILRGINVSGQKIIRMADLMALYEELNFKNVTTYIQSGNVVFNSNDGKDLAKRIKQKIAKKYNFQVPVIIRTGEEMKTVLNHNPFLKEKNIETDKLHVTFLAENPKPELIDKLKGLNFEPDRFIPSSKEVYLYCPNGYGRTKLSNNFFESKLNVTATTRNWRTVNELFKILSELNQKE
jgi:uncharacterized protein (DUF1697 family)